MSVDSLDRQRLGKQRVEAKQIYDVLTNRISTNAWKHHPAVLMWKGYEDALALYYNICLEFWAKRGYRNIKLKPIEISNLKDIKMPSWIGNDKFHMSHQSNLLKKKRDHYKQFFDVPDNLPYVWPTKEGLM